MFTFNNFLKRGEESTFKSRVINWGILTLLFIIFLPFMTSCGDDEEDEPPVIDSVASVLYGAWKAEAVKSAINVTTIVFNGDGTLWTQCKGVSGGVGNAAIFSIPTPEYRYKVFANTINLYEEAASKDKPTTVLTYSVNGDNLVLEYLTGEKPLFLTFVTPEGALNNKVTFYRK